MERDYSVLNKRKNYISVRNNINTFKKERKTICHLEMCFPLTDPFFFIRSSARGNYFLVLYKRPLLAQCGCIPKPAEDRRKGLALECWIHCGLQLWVLSSSR